MANFTVECFYRARRYVVAFTTEPGPGYMDGLRCMGAKVAYEHRNGLTSYRAVPVYAVAWKAIRGDAWVKARRLTSPT